MTDAVLAVGLFLVAMLYSAVGHGGASGYIALLSLTPLAGRPASTLALAMNLGVASVSFLAFQRARHFLFDLLWPFLLGSVPCAYLGGRLRVEGDLHRWLVAAALAWASWQLVARRRPTTEEARDLPTLPAVVTGAGIGLLSGIIGVGGGIFLSPVLLLGRWASVKQTAACSAVFIVANSAAGLAARSSDELAVVLQAAPLALAAVAGSIVGGCGGAFRATHPQLRVALGVVLMIAVVKIVSV